MTLEDENEEEAEEEEDGVVAGKLEEVGETSIEVRADFTRDVSIEAVEPPIV